jgi:hypothetical protein
MGRQHVRRLLYPTHRTQLPIVGLDLPGLPLLGLPPPVLVGDIFQRFTKDGVVQNIIEFSLPPLLQRERGAVFTVDARCVMQRAHQVRRVWRLLCPVPLGCMRARATTPGVTLERSTIHRQLSISNPQSGV